MQELQQPQTTVSGRKKVGRKLGSVPVNRWESLPPEEVGKQYGSVIIISDEIIREACGGLNRVYVRCVCPTCGEEKKILYTNLVGGRTKGCRTCNQPKRFPMWLYQRVQGQQQRCTNPKAAEWENYGARGIKFLFPSVADGVLWIMKNIGVHRELQLDRINNNGHYEPGNLRWSTQEQNMSHTRSSKWSVRFHQFRLNYPGVLYSDNTLRRLITMKTDEEIVARFYAESAKPKGGYGTYSIADPVIALQQMGY